MGDGHRAAADRGVIDPDRVVPVADTRWMVFCPIDDAGEVEIIAKQDVSVADMARALRAVADQCDALAELDDIANERGN